MTLRKLLSLSVLLLLPVSCASLVAGTQDRPNSYQSLRQDQQRFPKDRQDYLDPTIGAQPPAPPRPSAAKPCQRQCGPGLRCDASGPVERCVADDGARK